MRLTLKDVGFTYKKIMRGRQWVGRVLPKASGNGYVAKIGKDFVEAPTEREAFDLICARAFGFESAAELDRHNARVSGENRSRRERGRAIVDEYLRATTLEGRFAALDKIFK